MALDVQFFDVLILRYVLAFVNITRLSAHIIAYLHIYVTLFLSACFYVRFFCYLYYV